MRSVRGYGFLVTCGVVTAACGGSSPSAAGRYSDHEEYPAEPGKAAVVDAWSTPPALPPTLNDRFTKLHRDMELHPADYTGLWHSANGACGGFTINVAVPTGARGQEMARLKAAGLPTDCAYGINVEESADSTAEHLYNIQKDVAARFGGTVFATAIDWSRHLVRLSVASVDDHLRAQVAEFYGTDVALDIDEPANE